MRLPLDIACLLFFVSGGLARLARFNATVALVPTGKSGSIKFFTGIPIPSSLGLTAFMWGCAKTGHFVGAKGWTGSVGDVAGKLAAGKQVAEIDWAAIRRLGDLPGGTIKLFGEAGGIGEVHLLSFVFLAWAAAMVSKTLKVSDKALGLERLYYELTRLDVISSGAQALSAAGRYGSDHQRSSEVARRNPIDLETSMHRLIGKCDYINTNMRGLVDTRCCTETRAELDGQEPFPYDYRVRLPAAVPLHYRLRYSPSGRHDG
jgi:hypothetical protein